MKPRYLILPAIAASLAVAGCSTSSPTPPPNPSPLQYNALALGGSPDVRPANGAIEGTTENLVVSVGQRTYTLNQIADGGPIEGMRHYEYSSANPNHWDTGALGIFGSHSAAVLLNDGDSFSNDRAFVVIDGNPTRLSDMPPNQLATYSGVWHLAHSQGVQSNGAFDADVNFNSGRMDFDFYDQNSWVGDGAGEVRGTGFVGQTYIIDSTNDLTGQFYGPSAAEMAGLMEGRTSTGDSTGGALIGRR